MYVKRLEPRAMCLYLPYQNWAFIMFQTYSKLFTCYVSFNSLHHLMRFILLLLSFYIREHWDKEMSQSHAPNQRYSQNLNPSSLFQSPLLNRMQHRLLVFSSQSISPVNKSPKASTQTYGFLNMIKYVGLLSNSCFQLSKIVSIS